MRSWLRVDGDNFDEAFLAKHLQLKGTLIDAGWTFPVASRLLGMPASRHIQYWVNLLAKHMDARKILQREGYTFHLHIAAESGEDVSLTAEEIDLMARSHCGLVVSLDFKWE